MLLFFIVDKFLHCWGRQCLLSFVLVDAFPVAGVWLCSTAPLRLISGTCGLTKCVLFGILHIMFESGQHQTRYSQDPTPGASLILKHAHNDNKKNISKYLQHKLHAYPVLDQPHDQVCFTLEHFVVLPGKCV